MSIVFLQRYITFSVFIKIKPIMNINVLVITIGSPVPFLVSTPRPSDDRSESSSTKRKKSDRNVSKVKTLMFYLGGNMTLLLVFYVNYTRTPVDGMADNPLNRSVTRKNFFREKYRLLWIR